MFSAGDIANKRQVTVIERPGVSVHAALERMRQHGRELAVVVTADQHYQGLVTAEALAAELREAEPNYQRAFVADLPTVGADMPLNDVVHRAANCRYPLPVVDEDGRYLGTISKSAVLQTLDRTG